MQEIHKREVSNQELSDMERAGESNSNRNTESSREPIGWENALGAFHEVVTGRLRSLETGHDKKAGNCKESFNGAGRIEMVQEVQHRLPARDPDMHEKYRGGKQQASQIEVVRFHFIVPQASTTPALFFVEWLFCVREVAGELRPTEA